MKTMKNLFGSVIVLALLLISGCAAAPQKLRFVWPPLPDEPKIEYLGMYKSAKDLQGDDLVTAFLGGEISPFSLTNPQMAAGDGHGRVYVTDLKVGGVLIFDFNAKTLTMLGESGVLDKPTGIALDGDGNIYVADTSRLNIVVFTPQGKPSSIINLSSSLKSIGFIAIDKQRKRVIVPDPKENKVHIVDFKGAIITSFSTFKSPEEDGLNKPNAVAVAPNGDIVVADSFNARVVIFSPDGAYLSHFGERGDSIGQFNIIQGIAVDSLGHIYISDARSNRFSIMSAKGEALLVVGSQGDSSRQIGKFEIPFGISIDQNDTIYIVEKYYGRFQKYQHLTADYLAKNPITPEVLAKPTVDPKDTKKDSKTNPGK